MPQPDDASVDSPQADTMGFAAPLGGVMTDEVGTITGDLEAWLDDGRVKVRYAGALDHYTVTGEPGQLSLPEVVDILTADPGRDEHDNPRHTQLP